MSFGRDPLARATREIIEWGCGGCREKREAARRSSKGVQVGRYAGDGFSGRCFPFLDMYVFVHPWGNETVVFVGLCCRGTFACGLPLAPAVLDGKRVAFDRKLGERERGVVVGSSALGDLRRNCSAGWREGYS